MSTYPYEPEGDPIDIAELDIAEEAAFQDPSDKGLWHRLVHVNRVGDYLTAHLRFADNLGDNLDLGEVAIEVDDSDVNDVGSKITFSHFRKEVSDSKEKIIIGTAIVSSIVGAGTLIAVYKNRKKH